MSLDFRFCNFRYWDPVVDQPEIIVSEVGTHLFELPTIAFDGSTTPHVLWQDNPTGEVRHSYREGDDLWHPAFSVGSNAKHPCADECGGIIHAVWEQGSQPDIFIGMFTGTGWETCPIYDTYYPSQYPVLEDSHVVWSEPTVIPGDYEIFYSKWGGSGSSAEVNCGSDPQSVSKTVTPSMYPQGWHRLFEIRDPCDRFYVMWTEDLLSHQRLVFKDRVPAGP